VGANGEARLNETCRVGRIKRILSFLRTITSKAIRTRKVRTIITSIMGERKDSRRM
jgi:hypothetical protein